MRLSISSRAGALPTAMPKADREAERHRLLPSSHTPGFQRLAKSNWKPTVMGAQETQLM